MKNKEQPRAVILSVGETPTTDYFLAPHLEAQGYAVSLLDGRCESMASAFDGRRCQLVVISRYVSGCWLGVLERLRKGGVKLVYFMDDDLFDLAATRGLPWRYRWKILTQAWRHRARLMRLCDEFWVSTPYLAEKYAQYHPVLLTPKHSGKTVAVRDVVRVCYHGTASHPGEIAWLVPMMRSVLERDKDIHFELFGTRKVAKQFAGLPRVSVLHPMTWPNYLAYTSSHQCDIALAPLLPGAFNAARGPTKFYDHTRMGAAGLYSDVSPYRDFIRDGVDGVLLDSDPAHWVEAILSLAKDEETRIRIALAARQRVSDVIETMALE